MPRSALLYWICTALLGGSFLAFTAEASAFQILGTLSVLCLLLLFILKAFRIHLFWSLIFFQLGFWNGYTARFEHSLAEQAGYSIILEEPLKSSENWWRFYGTITPANGPSIRLLIHIKKGKLKPPVKGLICTPKKPWRLEPTSMPSTFDYTTYLNRKHIHHQLYLSPGEYHLRLGVEMDEFSAEKTKEFLYQKLDFFKFSSNAKAMILALSLGGRNYLDADLREQFANTGLIHLLALSGLHMGLLFLILQWITSPIKKVAFGNSIQIGIILFCLWGFCWLSGAAAATLRAVMMLSVWQLNKFLHRKTSSLTILALSAFILVGIHPAYIVSTGFQMSFLAVGGILWMAPIASKIGKKRSLFVQKIWGWIWICLAAQIAVAPISIYYFHQFAGIFLLANLSVFPLFGIYLASVFAIGIWAVFGNIPAAIVLGFNQLTDLFIRWVSVLAAQKGWIFEHLRLTPTAVIWVYMILLCSGWALKNQKKWNSIGILLTGIFGLYLGNLLYKPPPKIVWMGTTQKSYLGFQHHDSLWVYTAQKGDLSPYEKRNLGLRFGIRHFQTSDQLPKQFPKKIHHQIDLSIPKQTDSTIDILWMSNGPRIDFEQLLDSICPNTVWIDKTNPLWLTRHWKKTCDERSIAVIDMRKTGYRIIPL